MINSTFIWLVVWLPCFIFPLILGIIIPIDFHIFQRGGPTTNQLWKFFTNHEQPELHRSEKSFVAVAVVVESWSLVVVSLLFLGCCFLVVVCFLLSFFFFLLLLLLHITIFIIIVVNVVKTIIGYPFGNMYLLPIYGDLGGNGIVWTALPPVW